MEGVLDACQVEKRMSGVIVAQSMPWWSLFAHKLGVEISLVILRDSNLIHLAKQLVPNASFVVTKDDVDIVLRNHDLQGKCQALFTDERSPRFNQDWWKNGTSKLVLSAGSRQGQIPKGWKLVKIDLEHNLTGGVTDAKSSSWVWIRTKNDATALQGLLLKKFVKPDQDLRMILKMAKNGRPTSTPVNVPLPNQKSVNWYKEGKCLEAHGLYPLTSGDWDLNVRTKFGGNLFVERTLTRSERLDMMDVPEKLARKARHLELEDELLASAPTPLKILQDVTDRLMTAKEWWQPPRGPKRHSEIAEEASVPVKKLRTKEPCPNDDLEAKLKDLGQDNRNNKAVKVDDAEAPVEYWNLFVEQGLSDEVKSRDWEGAADVFRKYMHKRWVKNVESSFERWVGERLDESGTIDPVLLEAGMECIYRAQCTTFWTWNNGSRPFFWRWPKEFQERILYGPTPRFSGEPPNWRCRQKRPDDEIMAKRMEEKLADVIAKGYLEKGKVKSLMSYFAVDKAGGLDIRMVYDGTKCGLNDVLWAPWFLLPNADDLLDAVEPGTYMCDNDVGEMFLNFILHEKIRELTGVEVSEFLGDRDDKGRPKDKLLYRWQRNAMGLKPSPYNSIQGLSWLFEVIFGDRHDKKNVFRWDRVILNLPGDPYYDPSKTWVRKVRKDGTLAADCLTYVDDERPTGPTAIECWKAAQRISSLSAFYGIQDASRKRRIPNQEPGSWSGTDVHTSNSMVMRLVSQERWDGMKSILERLEEELKTHGQLNHSDLRRDRGKLVYATRGYNAMKPYLKGIHLTLENWRDDRDSEGWKDMEKAKAKRKQAEVGKSERKRKRSELELERDVEGSNIYLDSWNVNSKSLEEGKESGDLGLGRPNPPPFVPPVKRLQSDIQALKELTSADSPTKVMVRSHQVVSILYGFGDASGRGLGSSIRMADGTVEYRSGLWSMIEEHSSNYKELRNLVMAIQRLEESGKLDGAELFMFTDNSTAESAFFKGTSTSKALFELVLELRQIEMRTGSRLHIIHVPGTRMIDQGTDGLSRGDMNAGVMAGDDLMAHVPLHLSALDRRPKLAEWLQGWLTNKDGEEAEILEPERWFERHEGGGAYIWTPPPAAARRVNTELARSILKRPESMHAVLIPRLMTGYWRKVLSKICDLTLELPTPTPDHPLWDSDCHEPLILAIAFPLARNEPWRAKGSDRLLDLQGRLPDLWKDDPECGRSVLREFVRESWDLSAV